MTARELRDALDKICEAGNGDTEVYFDTDARKFGYHMAKIGSAYDETEMCEMVILTEARA